VRIFSAWWACSDGRTNCNPPLRLFGRKTGIVSTGRRARLAGVVKFRMDQNPWIKKTTGIPAGCTPIMGEGRIF